MCDNSRDMHSSFTVFIYSLTKKVTKKKHVDHSQQNLLKHQHHIDV